MDKVVAELEDYSIFHFTAEEALMAEANYPGLEAVDHSSTAWQSFAWRESPASPMKS